MIRRLIVMLGGVCSLLAYPAAAQVEADAQSAGEGEVIITAARRDIDGYDDRVPVIGLRRKADFALLEVTVTGDTRDAAKRHEEMYAMIRGAIQLADRRGIQLATGNTVVEPLTLSNYQQLSFKSDNRPDSERVSFLIKTPLADTDAKAAIAKMDGFIKAVPPVGRALITADDELTLSVVRPDQYRQQIVALVAADANATATQFGADYAIEARGIDRPVEWTRAGLTNVFLYVPYQLNVVPRRR